MPSKSMSRVAALVRQRALSYPDTSEDFPWGESAFKVKGKTFVFMRADGTEVRMTLKLAASRDFALSLPRSEPTHYGLGKHGWVTLRPNPRTPADVLGALIDESFRLVAPKRLVALLGAKAGKPSKA